MVKCDKLRSESILVRYSVVAMKEERAREALRSPLLWAFGTELVRSPVILCSMLHMLGGKAINDDDGCCMNLEYLYPRRCIRGFGVPA